MRIVCISDTHMRHKKIEHMPEGDVLVHAGDFMTDGYSRTEIRRFVRWMDSLDYKHKIFIAGNHDRMFESEPSKAFGQIPYDCNVTYLQDEAITIDGVKFYGSPWQPEFCGWAFNLPRGEAIRKKWDQIPKDTNVLITHGPPKGILDEAPDYHIQGKMFSCGCEELREVVKTLPDLKCHVFGHIHDGYGEASINGGVRFINAAVCNEDYAAVNKPIVYDYKE
jgi:Icc-related predicted phosphoesterase